MATRSAYPLQIVWFKRDLRADDHAPLAEAAAHGPVLPLYIVDPGLWTAADASRRQWAFAAESLGELRNTLAARGQPLVVRVGDAVEVLEQLRRTYTLAGLWSHQETGNWASYQRDVRVRRWARTHGLPWTERRQHGVIRGLKTRNGWAREWGRFMAQPASRPPNALAPIDGLEEGPIPTADDLGLAADPCPNRQPGGRAAATGLLESFLTERGRDYRREMSSPVTAFDACSRLSPHFAFGTLSMREAAQAAWAAHREAEPPWRGSLNSFEGRLHWHCHFMQKLEDAPEIEWRNLHPAADVLDRSDDPSDPRLRAWAKGETGFPFVDACLRALIATGWLNFRMRAMLQAVACYHLWLHWQQSGLVLARYFTDYEAGIHWSQSQMQAGTTGINTTRIYNPVKQGYDQDPEGAFVRAWVPELAQVPDAYIHEPWTWPNAHTLLGDAYPERIVDHQTAARAARQKMGRMRATPEARRQADRIQEKHGSRKSGVRNAGHGRSGGGHARTKTDRRQTGFDFDDG
ncbi:deoxyribodipyrimidine photolyase [Rhodovibrio sodomensis]|uniref:Deoxyribodipyrimidine photolyase n=1 Tax=Rhodovibrio sodomensis TaxID=1088 RepID=A0ABS1DB95_9PROT|nr:FAD-binding domain-containing protein [Rhodovibrio sodomensis]MBK1667660.1 deoxyribodipyrimidine photolyase [Rhodovibrio sodomensis]